MAADHAKADLEVAPLTAATWDALAALFASGGDPRWCWCQYWRRPNSSWSNADPEGNRADLRALADLDPAPGLVALREGVAVGWVGLGPRVDFERLARARTIPQLPGDDVWVVNCFVVAKAARRRGVASALLEAAVDYAQAYGARLVEGYPVQTGGARMSSASAYTGTARMFERAGFDVVAPTTSHAAKGLPRIVVRRQP